MEAITTRDKLVVAAREELVSVGSGALSLRAVARRAGLSHAAPAHFFRDKAGLLTAVATEGFRELSARLDAIADRDDVGAQGRAYLAFGAEHPALIDLMFRSDALHDDPELDAARREAIERLASAIGERGGGEGDGMKWTLISWAFVHGLVTLGREGMLTPFSDGAGTTPRGLSESLVGTYASALPPRAREHGVH